MSSQQSHTGPLSLISCVSARESSPIDDAVESKSEAKKKRFHPFRNLRRMFRRKNRQLNVGDVVDDAIAHERGIRILEPKSCSTGRLIDEDQTQTRRRSSSLAPGLSLSHDSVFKPDRTDSGHSSSDLENSSLSIPTLLPTPRVPRFQAELANVIRRRVRDDSDDEDLGLPRSRCSSLATDYPDKFADRAGKSQSSCSEGSLLSTGSSFEDDLHTSGEGSDLDLKVTRHILSHSAAKHKMAVRPRRNHAPGAKRPTQKSVTPLPVTPEVNEETAIASLQSLSENPSPEPMTIEVALPALNGSTAVPVPVEPMSLALPSPTRPETWSKSASLPHGAALNAEPKVSRSLSMKAAKVEGAKETEIETDARPIVMEEEPKRDCLLNVSDERKRPSLTQLNDDESLRSSLTKLNDEQPRRPSLTKPTEDVPRRPSLTKSLSRRQRVDPIEIPVNAPAASRMRVSYSTSPPPVPTWPAASPPKAIWPEMRLETQPERTGMFIKNESRTRRDSRDSKPPIQKSQSFHKDVPAPVYNYGSSLPKNLADDDSNKRLYLKNRKIIRKEEKDTLNAKLTKKSSSLESIDNGYSLPAKSFRSSSTDSVRSNDEPQYANLRQLLPGQFDGYENIEIIEFVKKEQRDVEKPKITVPLKEPTLVERRKSELQFTVNDEPVRIFKKQTSLIDCNYGTVKDVKRPVSVQEMSPTKNFVHANVVIVEKQEEVVLRRKSQSAGNHDEPELMKVFARRSLKAKDDDDVEGSRSRDSDKENESIEEPIKKPENPTSPFKPVTPLKPAVAVRNSVFNKFPRVVAEKPAATDKSVSVKRPSIAKDLRTEQIIDEPKKIEEMLIEKLADTGKVSEEIVDGPGFKRIQDRRAEWEKRLQAAKN